MATDISNLSTLMFTKGDAEEGERLLREAIDIHLAVHGPSHPGTLIAQTNLAFAFFERQDFDAAKQTLEEVLRRRKEALGEEHASVGLTLYLLGQVARAEGDHAAALEHYRAAQRIMELHLVPDHPQRMAVGQRIQELTTP